MISLYMEGKVDDLKEGIGFLQDDLQIRLTDQPDEAQIKISVIEAQKEDTLQVIYHAEDGSAQIAYSRRITFFRALGLLMQHLREKENEDYTACETMYFTLNGPMYDVSQGNAVINLKTVKTLLRTMAVMGLDMLMLYCEDSYQVKEEPYFGYMRGKYTEEDMRRIDDYAYALGIEVIPCIQTLAHMANTFRWDGVYGDIMEDDECMLVGEPKVYEFIRRLLIAASRPFRTKRIHIGMDEAWKLGLGKYLRLHGYTEKTVIMQEHLRKVMEIVRELGLQPMMWADMFFRAITPHGEYYVPGDFKVPESTRDAVPEDVELVYWDYYHDQQDVYAYHIDKHRALCHDPGKTIFAGGIWTWIGFGADWPITFGNSLPAVRACKEKGVREVIITVWGDRATECNILATLPGLCFYAEHGYRQDPSMEEIAKRFEFVTGAKWDDFMRFAEINYIPGTEKGKNIPYSPSKFLMYQDVLEGLFDANLDGDAVRDYYLSLTKAYEESIGRNGKYDSLMKFYYLVSGVLEIKADLGIQLRKAYLSGDHRELGLIRDEVLPELQKRVQALKEYHRDLWSETYQLFGWDIMDIRYGGIISRAETAIYRIGRYLLGDQEALAELDEPRLYYNGREGIPHYTNWYEQIYTPSTTAR
ncbi:MAG: beta-N-acetylhexosaminidase [Firmicutes bacterium]|nr:beta-N-acetylhexosaminidase [Bacillota bacterium]